MNLNKKIPAAIALASCLLLPSCDFNEDFCTRYGELIAYCDLGKHHGKSTASSAAPCNPFPRECINSRSKDIHARHLALAASERGLPLCLLHR